MADLYAVPGETLTGIADAIRSKTGSDDFMTVASMAAAIEGISGGGDSGAYFKYSGLSPELISEYHEVYSLADTSFVIGDTAPTALTTIRASEAGKVIIPVNLADIDVVLVETLTVTPTYSSDARDFSKQKKYLVSRISWIVNSDTSTDDVAASNSSVVGITSTYNYYYNSRGSQTVTAQAGYGMNGSFQNGPPLSASNRPDISIRVGSPTLACRADTNQSSADNMRKITECTWAWDVEAYRVNKGSCVFSKLRDEMNIKILKQMEE